jgi:hypothetical protein
MMSRPSSLTDGGRGWMAAVTGGGSVLGAEGPKGILAKQMSGQPRNRWGTLGGAGGVR